MSRVDCNNCAALFKSVGTLADGIAALRRDNAALREALQAIYSMDRDAPQGQTGPVYRDIMAVMSATARAVLRQAD